MANYAMTISLLVGTLLSIVLADYDPFADNVLFSLNWQGAVDLVDHPITEVGVSKIRSMARYVPYLYL